MGRGTLVGLYLVAVLAIGAVTAASAAASDTVLAWGYNARGGLGDGTDSGPESCEFGDGCSRTPIDVNLPSGVTATAVSAGWEYGLALLSNGTVMAWGANEEGQLGNGTTTNSDVPVQVTGLSGVGVLSGVTAVSAGVDNSLALLSNGRVMAWGSNQEGELGDGTTTSSDVPVEVSLPSGVPATAVSAGWEYGLAVLGDHEVMAWGYNGHGQLGDATSSGPESCNNISPPCSKTPVAVAGLGGVGTLSGVTSVSADDNHSVALLGSGEVAAWGDNEMGQLGDASTTASDVPVLVKGPGGVGALSGVTAVSSDGYRSLALLGGGEVRDWGYEVAGDLGEGSITGPESCSGGYPCSKTPVEVRGPGGVGALSGVTSVSAGLDHNLALLGNGAVMAWGANEEGELGDGTGPESCFVISCSKFPVAVKGIGGTGTLGGVSAISAGGLFSLAIEGGPAPAHWYSNGELIREGEPESVTTTGSLTFSRVVVEESEVTCTVTDRETIENPVGGGAGSDQITQFALSHCFIPSLGPPGNAPVCGLSTPEAIAHHLPWTTRLTSGSPESDEIGGIELELKCSNGTALETLTGSLRPTVGSGVLTFTTGTGALTQVGYTGITHVIGTDSFTGPTGDELITTTPVYPHWYSNGKPIAEGNVEPVASGGTFTVAVAGKASVGCKVKDRETIVNPSGGTAGTDELTEFVASGCAAKPSPCPGSKIELLAHKLPWATHLVAGPPVADVIDGVELEVRCSNGTVIEKLDETLAPTVGASVLDFAGAAVSAADKLTGPKGDETITAGVPGLPRWYSNGKPISEGETEPVVTDGTFTFDLLGGGAPVRCKVKDGEIVMNPAAGAAGTDELTEFLISGCTGKASPCPRAKLQLQAVGLPWLARLIPGSPIADVIDDAEVEAKCSSGAVLGTMRESLTVPVGESALDFATGFMTGTDKLKGPPGDQRITAASSVVTAGS